MDPSSSVCADALPGLRRNSDIPGVLVLHYADVPESDMRTAQDFKATRPLRTVLRLMGAATVERDFIR